MAQVTTADIRTRIKDMIEADAITSSILKSVFDIAPMALQRGATPALVITDGNGTYDNGNLGERYIKPNIGFTLALYMQEWTANSTVNINANGIDAITTAIENLFRKNARLNYNGQDLKGVRQSQLTNVTGIAPRPYPSGGTPYVHKQWTLQVIYSRTV
jgi:hypothetical protein